MQQSQSIIYFTYVKFSKILKKVDNFSLSLYHVLITASQIPQHSANLDHSYEIPSALESFNTSEILPILPTLLEMTS